MIKKFSLLMVVALSVMTTACKKQNTAENTSDTDTITVAQPSVTSDHNEATAAPVPADGKYPVMTFEEEEHDFGTIKQGDKVVHDFEFKNTGEADLLITSAKGSCGCTVPDYPKTPIKPGESGNIKVSFDSAGKSGETTKTVTIMCNIEEGNKILKIKANIEVPKGAK